MKLYPNVSIIFGIWAAAILIIFFFGIFSFPHSSSSSKEFFKSLANWDGGHYLGIADGYDKTFQYAFFPLYPLLINLVSQLTGSFLTAGILISVVSSFLAVNLFYQLVTIEFGKESAQKSLYALLFFPVSFYFLTVYTEGLFFLLTIATFILARKRRLLLAVVFASLASATRLAGLAVVLGLVSYVYMTAGYNRKNWFIIFAPLGFVLYSFYLYQQTGDPFYFVQAESHWQRQLVIPGSALFENLKSLFAPGFITKDFRTYLDLVFAALGIGLIWKVWKKLSIDYAIFSIVSLLLPLFSPTLLAFPRYLLTVFPVFIVMSLYKNQYIIFAYQIFSLLFLAGFTILFITGYWVT